MSNSSMELHEFLRTRKSVRRFRPEPIPTEVLDRILETTSWAPSAHNRQPWRLVVLSSSTSRECLVEKMSAQYRIDLAGDGLDDKEIEAIVRRSRDRIMDAPAAILLCQDTLGGDSYPDPERQQAEHLMGVQSVALAGGTLLLAAHAEGVGGVWMCAPLFAQGAVRDALNLPGNWQPQVLILLGYPGVLPDPRPRRPVSELVRVV